MTEPTATRPPADLSGRRILVVGASSGIGAAVAHHAARAGARTAWSGRRAARLASAASEAGGVVVAGDVRVAEDCERIAGDAAAALGGLDALVYAAGITPLAPLADADAAHWRDVLETNVVGAALVTRAALPHLGAGGIAAFLSSDSVGRPRHGLAGYSASKAALDECILAWRREHPDRRFLRVVVGPTVGTDVARAYPPTLLAQLIERWSAHAFMTEKHMQADDLGALLAEVLAVALAHPEIAVEDLRVEPTGGVAAPSPPG